jgi:hypothetical protein
VELIEWRSIDLHSINSKSTFRPPQSGKRMASYSACILGVRLRYWRHGEHGGQLCCSQGSHHRIGTSICGRGHSTSSRPGDAPSIDWAVSSQRVTRSGSGVMTLKTANYTISGVASMDLYVPPQGEGYTGRPKLVVLCA